MLHRSVVTLLQMGGHYNADFGVSHGAAEFPMRSWVTNRILCEDGGLGHVHVKRMSVDRYAMVEVGDDGAYAVRYINLSRRDGLKVVFEHHFDSEDESDALDYVCGLFGADFLLTLTPHYA